MFTGDNSCYLYQGREGEEQILVIAPHQGRISSQLWLTVQRKLSQNTSFQNGRKCHNTWLAGKIKCGRCGYALAALRAQNGVTYLRCKQRAENGSCEGAGTLTAQSMEAFVYGEMVKKMQKFHTLKGGKEQSYNPKLTAARVALAKTESEIEKLLDTLSGQTRCSCNTQITVLRNWTRNVKSSSDWLQTSPLIPFPLHRLTALRAIWMIGSP